MITYAIQRQYVWRKRAGERRRRQALAASCSLRHQETKSSTIIACQEGFEFRRTHVHPPLVPTLPQGTAVLVTLQCLCLNTFLGLTIAQLSCGIDGSCGNHPPTLLSAGATVLLAGASQAAATWWLISWELDTHRHRLAAYAPAIRTPKHQHMAESETEAKPTRTPDLLTALGYQPTPAAVAWGAATAAAAVVAVSGCTAAVRALPAFDPAAASGTTATLMEALQAAGAAESLAADAAAAATGMAGTSGGGGGGDAAGFFVGCLLLGSCLLAPLAEEVLFRGVLLRSLVAPQRADPVGPQGAVKRGGQAAPVGSSSSGGPGAASGVNQSSVPGGVGAASAGSSTAAIGPSASSAACTSVAAGAAAVINAADADADDDDGAGASSAPATGSDRVTGSSGSVALANDAGRMGTAAAAAITDPSLLSPVSTWPDSDACGGGPAADLPLPLPLPAAAWAGAVVVQAAAFASYHLSAVEWPAQFVLGVVLGCGYLGSGGNLAASLTAHVLYNSIAVVMLVMR